MPHWSNLRLPIYSDKPPELLSENEMENMMIRHVCKVFRNLFLRNYSTDSKRVSVLLKEDTLNFENINVLLFFHELHVTRCKLRKLTLYTYLLTALTVIL